MSLDNLFEMLVSKLDVKQVFYGYENGRYMILGMKSMICFTREVNQYSVTFCPYNLRIKVFDYKLLTLYLHENVV